MNWYKLQIRLKYNPEIMEEVYLLAHSAEDALVCQDKQEYNTGRCVSIICVDQPPEDNIQYQMWKSKQNKNRTQAV